MFIVTGTAYEKPEPASPLKEATGNPKIKDFRMTVQIGKPGSSCMAVETPWEMCQDFVDYAKKNAGGEFAHPGTP